MHKKNNQGSWGQKDGGTIKHATLHLVKVDGRSLLPLLLIPNKGCRDSPRLFLCWSTTECQGASRETVIQLHVLLNHPYHSWKFFCLCQRASSHNLGAGMVQSQSTSGSLPLQASMPAGLCDSILLGTFNLPGWL